jgi:hypothetical protein
MRRLVDPYAARLPIPDARHAGRSILAGCGKNGQETTAAQEVRTQIGKVRNPWREAARYVKQAYDPADVFQASHPVTRGQP